MSDVGFYCEEVESEIQAIEVLIDRAESLSGLQDRAPTIENVKSKLSNLQTTRRIFNMELRKLDKQRKPPYQVKLQFFDECIARLTILSNDLSSRDVKNSDETMRTALFDGRKNVQFKQPHSPQSPSKEKLLGATHDVQDKTEDALYRVLGMAKETNEVGDTIINQLGQQTEQLSKINQGLENIDTELDKAKAVMQSFFQRMKTDKVIIVFIGLIIIGFVGLLLYLAVTKKI